ncbi:MAG: hypothetical protein ABFC84_17995 [Veillonellales bacterium]
MLEEEASCSTDKKVAAVPAEEEPSSEGSSVDMLLEELCRLLLVAFRFCMY